MLPAQFLFIHGQEWEDSLFLEQEKWLQHSKLQSTRRSSPELGGHAGTPKDLPRLGKVVYMR